MKHQIIDYYHHLQLLQEDSHSDDREADIEALIEFCPWIPEELEWQKEDLEDSDIWEEL